MSKDLMGRLVAARPEHLDPDRAVEDETRSAELAHAMAAPRDPRVPAPAGRRTRRVMWGLGLAGATAVAVVAATTLTGTTGGRATAHGPGTTAAPVTLDARAVLLSAADQAYREPAQTGAYYYTQTLSHAYMRAGGAAGPYTMVQGEREESWTPKAVGKSQAQWSRSQYLGATPATPADQAAWQRDGAPRQVRSKIAKNPRKGTVTLPTAAGRVETSHQPLVDGDKVFWLGHNVTMKELAALPDTPEGLKARLLRSYTGRSTESSSIPMSQDLWLFETSAGLITDMPVTAKVRGAAFRMLAGLKSVTSVGRIKDAQGRTGVGVTVVDSHGTTEHRLIVDPGSGRALGDETIAVKPINDLPAGSMISSSTVLKAGWTDTPPASG